MADIHLDNFSSNSASSVSSGSKWTRENTAGVFQIVLLTLLVFTIFRVLTRGAGGGTTSFYVDLGSLLTKLSKAPKISTDWINILSTNYGDTFPYGFQWLGEAIDFFVSILAGVAFASVAVTNALVFVFYFLRWALM